MLQLQAVSRTRVLVQVPRSKIGKQQGNHTESKLSSFIRPLHVHLALFIRSWSNFGSFLFCSPVLTLFPPSLPPHIYIPFKMVVIKVPNSGPNVKLTIIDLATEMYRAKQYEIKF
jgi:hypothetical protein